jgi:hypothetical protein
MTTDLLANHLQAICQLSGLPEAAAAAAVHASWSHHQPQYQQQHL